MMKLLIVLFGGIILASLQTLAQNTINISSYVIESEVLNEKREIQVYLPESYEESVEKYPILFVLDGQWHFTNGVAIQKSLRTPDLLPEMVVVGIKNKNPLRRELFNDGRENFISLLGNEVIPFLEKKFRVSDDRVLFGWESAAYFSCFAIFHESQLFNAAIATNGAYIDKQMLDAFIKLNPSTKKHLFITNSIKDIYNIENSDATAQFLKENTPDQLNWKYQLFNHETHESLPYLAMYYGLNHYYYNFQSLVFSSIKEFEELGGISYVENYYKVRGERFGFSTAVDDDVKNALIWLAWKRNNLEYFNYFMNEFQEVLLTKRYASSYWQDRLAQFYLKNNNPEKAIEFFSRGINQYPDSSRMSVMYYGMAKAFRLKNNKKEAKANLKKAIETAKKEDNPYLEEYERLLKELN